MQGHVAVTKYFVFIFLALFAITQIPLYWVEYPDIQDFLNHLARLHILLQLSESDALQQYYTFRHLKVGTNLAMEVIVPLLAKAMSLILALKIFSSLAMFLTVSGAAALGRAINGRSSYLLLGVLFFTLNEMLQMGLLNYLFGLGLAFWLLTAWIYARNHFSLGSWIAFSLGGILVYLCHLSAFGVYAVCVLGYELARQSSKGPLMCKSSVIGLLLPLTQFVPTVMLHMLASVSAGIDTPPPIEYSWLELPFLWVIYKLLLLGIAPLISVSGYIVGQIIFGFLLIFTVYVGYREGLLKLSATVKWMAGLLLLCIFLLPDAGFGSRLVDARLIPALGLILWSGLQLDEDCALNPKLLLGLIVVIVVLISVETGRQWTMRDVEYKSVRVALQQIPEGSKVATIMLDEPKTLDNISSHSGAFSVIDRSALLSNMFIWPYQPFWVAYREPYVPFVKPVRLDNPETPAAPYEDIKRYYHYILIFGGNATKRMQYGQNAETVFSSNSLRMIRTDLAQLSNIKHTLED
jgi:hypothetical protein